MCAHLDGSQLVDEVVHVYADEAHVLGQPFGVGREGWFWLGEGRRGSEEGIDELEVGEDEGAEERLERLESVCRVGGIKHFGDAHLVQPGREFLDGPGFSKDGVAAVLHDPVDIRRLVRGVGEVVVGVAVVQGGRGREEARVKLGGCCWSVCGPARARRRHGARSSQEQVGRATSTGFTPWR